MVPQPQGHFNVVDTVPRKTPDGRKVWVNFLPNIDLGHLLTMLGFAAALVVQWNLQDRRITIIEQRLAQNDSQITEMKQDLKDIKTALVQIQTSLAVQAYITTQTAGKK